MTLLIVLCLGAIARVGRSVGTTIPSAEVIMEARSRFQQMAGTAPESTSEDLALLDGLLARRRLVGLGEATHGTREFFRIKHRIIRRLVEVHQTRLVLMEVSWDRARQVDAYLREGEGSAGAAVAGMGFWTWRVQEMVELVEWLRAFNLRHPHDMVRFAGIDPQLPPEEGSPVADAVPGVGPDEVRRQHARMARMPFRWAKNIVRDRSMAENVLAFVGRVQARGPVALWAHNGHVRRTALWMGGWIGKELEDAYLVLGLTAHSGGFNAIRHEEGGPARLAAGPLPAARPGSLEAMLFSAGARQGWIDVRSAGRLQTPLGRWLRGRPLLRSEGAVASADPRTGGAYPEAVASSYDVLFFVAQSSPSLLLPPTGAKTGAGVERTAASTARSALATRCCSARGSSPRDHHDVMTAVDHAPTMH